jgi:hypothetical protein
MNRVFGGLALAVLITATWLTLSHHPLSQPINNWQATIMGDNKFFPVLTIFVLAIPPLLLLLVIKYIMRRK